MQRAVETLDHFPSIAQIEELAATLGIESCGGWKYVDCSDCLKCGGVGWHYVTPKEGGEAVVACDDCRAGKNQQIGPKGTITWTMSQCPGAIYSRPGRGSKK